MLCHRNGRDQIQSGMIMKIILDLLHWEIGLLALASIMPNIPNYEAVYCLIRTRLSDLCVTRNVGIFSEETLGTTVPQDENQGIFV